MASHTGDAPQVPPAAAAAGVVVVVAAAAGVVAVVAVVVVVAVVAVVAVAAVAAVVAVLKATFPYSENLCIPSFHPSRPGFWYVTLFQLNGKGMVWPVKFCMV